MNDTDEENNFCLFFVRGVLRAVLTHDIPVFFAVASFFPLFRFRSRLLGMISAFSLSGILSYLTFGVKDEKDRDLRKGRYREVHDDPEHGGRPGGNGK
jgi:hypothetical protein